MKHNVTPNNNTSLALARLLALPFIALDLMKAHTRPGSLCIVFAPVHR